LSNDCDASTDIIEEDEYAYIIVQNENLPESFVESFDLVHGWGEVLSQYWSSSL
jgi:hypothetical protein